MTIMPPSAWGLLALYCSSLPLLVRFWKANRHTSLTHAIVWAGLAWIAWILSVPLEPPGNNVGVCIYVALALTGCASIAILGARRPGVTMWNAVVAALLLMELSPWGEAAIQQKDIRLDGLRLAILAGAIAIGVMNYLPTRAGLGALLIGFGCTCEWMRFMNADGGIHEKWDWIGRFTLAAAPGTVMLCRKLMHQQETGEFDRCWIGFRERFGVVWGQRLREQFNQAVRHANWQVLLAWQGLRSRSGAEQPTQEEKVAMFQTLNAAMKRFGGAERSDSHLGKKESA
jgi:hypothetical protein